jgi:excisionase family DNA binding protein
MAKSTGIPGSRFTSLIMVDMNPLTIQQIRSPQQDTASPSSSVRQHPAACKPVEKTAMGCPSSAMTDVSSVLSDDRLVVSVAEAGRLLGVSRAFAYELAARGELPTIRLGRRILAPKAALLAMVGLSYLQS